MSEIPDEKVQEYAARMRALLQIPEFNPDSTYPNVFAADGALVINSRVYNAGRQQEDVYFPLGGSHARPTGRRGHRAGSLFLKLGRGE